MTITTIENLDANGHESPATLMATRHTCNVDHHQQRLLLSGSLRHQHTAHPLQGTALHGHGEAAARMILIHRHSYYNRTELSELRK